MRNLVKTTCVCVVSMVSVASLFAKGAKEKTYTVNDYVQDGLVAHFDGVCNDGLNKPHNPSATVWKNLVKNGPDLTIVVCDGKEKNTAKWTADAWQSDASSYAKMTEALAWAVGKDKKEITIQLVADKIVCANQQLTPGYLIGVTDEKGNKKGLMRWGGGGKTYWEDFALSNTSTGWPFFRTFVWNTGCLTARATATEAALFTKNDIQNVAAKRQKAQTFNNRKWSVGCNYDGNGNAVKGLYHSIRIYNRALTPEELAHNRTVDNYRFKAARKDFNIFEMPPKDQKLATIKDVKIIHRVDNRHAAWPSVCCLKNGDVLAVFSGDRQAHVCGHGKVQIMRSKDKGQTWTVAKTIVDTIIDDRDAGIIQLPDGEVIVNWFTSVCYAGGINGKALEKFSKDELKKVMGDFIIRSKDNGETWSEPEQLSNFAQSPHGPIVLKDGSLLQVGRCSRESPIAATYNEYKSTIMPVSKSTDGGKTWKVICPEIPMSDADAKRPFFHEPHVAQLKDGTLVAMARYHGPGGQMTISFSKNGGKTWSVMKKTPLLGLPPHLLTLPDGRLLCTYGRRSPQSKCWNPAYGIYASISKDGGKTWDENNEIQLFPGDATWDLGYPASCLLPDGDILTVYYYKPPKPINAERTWIMTTRWRLK